MTAFKRRDAIVRGAIVVLAALFAFSSAACSNGQDWRTASRESAGIAPSPAAHPGAVLQVYGARTWGWRGYFAIHTWLAAKKTGESSYTVYEVIGWRLRGGDSALRVARDVPDRRWYGAEPRLLWEKRGAGVDAMIDAVNAAVKSYPWPDVYEAFPGPNSNTFTAWVIDNVPGLGARLPRTAIGSGYAR